MPADTDVNSGGCIVDVLQGGKFKVKLDHTGKEIIAYVSGKMRMNSIKVVPGDRVNVAMSPYDLTKGRITRRE